MPNFKNLSQQDYLTAKQLFNQAIQLDSSEMATYIKNHCKDNGTLYDAVMSLVNMHLTAVKPPSHQKNLWQAC